MHPLFTFEDQEYGSSFWYCFDGSPRPGRIALRCLFLVKPPELDPYIIATIFKRKGM
jgi:hypothetical protein